MTFSLSLTLTDILLAILLIVLIILGIYLIVFIAKLLPNITYLHDALVDIAHISNKARAGIDDAEAAMKNIERRAHDLKRNLFGKHRARSVLSYLLARFVKDTDKE